MYMTCRYQQKDGTWRGYEVHVPVQIRGVNAIAAYVAAQLARKWARALRITDEETIAKYVFRQTEVIRQELIEKVEAKRRAKESEEEIEESA